MQKRVKKVSKFVNKPFDFIICAVIFILLALGIVMVLSASAPSALAEHSEPYSYAVRQLIFAILGIISMFVLSKIDYRIYKKFYWPIYFINTIIYFRKHKH